MKNKKLLLIIAIAVVVLAAVVGIVIALTGGEHACQSKCEICGKCTDKDCTEAVCAEKCPGHGTDGPSEGNVLLSGLTGKGYSFAVEGYTVADGKVQIPSGTEVQLTLTLDESYAVGTPVVKLDGTELTGNDNVYTCTVSKNAEVTVEGVYFYEIIGSNPFNVDPADTTTDDLGSTMSKVSNIITAEWKADGYSFANVRLEQYLSLAFYVKADNCWIAFRDRLGQFNDVDEPIYANAVTNPETGAHEPDNVWHKYELKRETDADGVTAWQLYVDGVKHDTYSDGPVDARIKNKLTDFLLDINGTYYVSELFGCVDPEYDSSDSAYTIYAQSPLINPQDEYSTDDYPCEESVRINVYNRAQWGRENLISLPLGPYEEVKFYMSCPASGWIVGNLGGKDVAVFSAGTGWHEFLIMKEGDKFALYVDGAPTDEYFGANLNELQFTLNEYTYYVSELFVMADPEYVPPVFELVTGDFLGLGNPESSEKPEDEDVEGSFAYTPSVWTATTFEKLNALEYDQLKFYVRAPGQDDKWIVIQAGTNAFLQVNDDQWHEISLVKVKGYSQIYVDGVHKGAITNLAQLQMLVNENATYYYTGIYGVKDDDFEGITVALPEGEGFDIFFENVYVEDNAMILEKGSALSFRVTLQPDYDKSVYTVQVDGKLITAVDGLYTVTVDHAIEIKLAGVNVNSVRNQTIVLNPFDIVGEPATDMEAPGFDHVTKLTTTWNKYNFVSVDLSKYSEIRFAVKSSGWYGVMADGQTVIDETTGNGNWLVIKMERLAGGWQLSYGDKIEQILMIPSNNLNALNFRFGTDTYYVTELKGVPLGAEDEPDPGPGVGMDGYVNVSNNIVATNPTNIITAGLPSNLYTLANVFNCGWTSPGMVGGIEMAKYTELKFCYKVSDSGKWFEMYNADGEMIYAGSNTNWTEVKFVWEEGCWTLYVDDVWTKSNMNGVMLKDIVATLTLGGAVTADVYVTNLIGIPNEDVVVSEYEQISTGDPLGKDSAASADVPASDFVTGSFKFEPATWTQFYMNALNVMPYSDVKFYVKSDGQSDKWLVLEVGTTSVLAVNDDQWHEIWLKKNEGYATIYVDGEQKAVLSDLAQIKVTVNDGGVYHCTSIYGIKDAAYQGATMTLPAGDGFTVNVNTAYVSGTEVKLENGSVVTFTLSLLEGYEESTPVVKANGAVLTPVDGVYTVTLNGDVTITVENVVPNPSHEPAADWSKDETGHWHDCSHCDKKLDFAEHTPGEPIENVITPATETEPGSKEVIINCSVCGYEISRTTVEIPVTSDPYVEILDNPFDVTGEASTEAPCEGFEHVTVLNTSWNKYNFKALDLSGYTEVKFAVKSSGWYGVMADGSNVIGETDGGGDWLVIKLVKVEGGWDLYYGDAKQQTLTLANNNMTDLNFRFGSATYYVTEIRGIPMPDPFEEILDNPFDVTGEASTEAPCEGFEHVTVLNTSWNKYNFKALDLSGYTEVKFAVKSSGWYGVMADGSNVIGETDGGGDWLVIKLVKVEGGWDLYYGDAKQQTLTLANNNMTDLNFRFGSNTYYVTEIRGISAEESDEPYVSPYISVVSNPLGTDPTSTTTEELPSEDVNIVNIYNCGWASPGLVDGITLANYTELKFYYKVSDGGKWFEMYDASGALYQGNATAWTEIKFVLEGEVWTLYVDGVWTKSNLTGTTLKDIVATLTLGGSVTADVYITDIVGLEAPYVSPYISVVSNPLGTDPTSTTTEELPSEDVNIVNIYNCGWASPGLVDGITLANYTELKFCYKVSDTGKWFEMYDASGALYQGNATAWTEIKFVLEGEVWTLYVDGQWKKSNLTGTTLKDIVATLTLGGSVTADVYMTDIIGLEA